MHVFQAGGSCLSLLTARSAEGFSDLDNIIQESESQYNDREYDWIQSNYGCSQRGEGLDLISAPGFLYSVLALTGLARNFVGWSMLYFGWIMMSRLLGPCLSIFIYVNTCLPHCILVDLFTGGGVGRMMLARNRRVGMGEEAGRQERLLCSSRVSSVLRALWLPAPAPDAAV